MSRTFKHVPESVIPAPDYHYKRRMAKDDPQSDTIVGRTLRRNTMKTNLHRESRYFGYDNEDLWD